MDFREQVPLAPYTTFQIGGPARWFAEAKSEDEIAEAVRFARRLNLPLLILGGGSNVLIRDGGFPGVVVRIASSGIHQTPLIANEFSEFSVAAGVNWDQFVSLAVEQGCGGIECLAGIPGTVGGTPIQNVGAYGQEVSSTILSVSALELATLKQVSLTVQECGFAYRSSIFNTTCRGQYIVTNVLFRLPSAAGGSVEYKDLKQYFKNCSALPTVAEVASAVREIRRGKGMLLVPGDPDCRSAGSFFKNPVVPIEKLASVASAASVTSEAVPHFPAGAGSIKILAAWLVEQAGFHKGYRLGRAGISSRHSLALINADQAKANDILVLRDEVVSRIRSRFGIDLDMEPVLIG